MGTDCKFIAKIKGVEQYQSIYLDRLYKFESLNSDKFGGKEIEDCPFLEIGTDFDILLNWLENAIDKTTDNYCRAWYIMFRNLIHKYKHNWESGQIWDDHSDEYFDLNGEVINEG